MAPDIQKVALEWMHRHQIQEIFEVCHISYLHQQHRGNSIRFSSPLSCYDVL
jgi:hypothetical protein